MTLRNQLLFAVPAALGGLVAIGVVGFLGWPQWKQVEVGRSRVAELRGLEAQLPLLSRQLQREQVGVREAQRQQTLVLQLIAGSGSLATFMAQVDRLAALSGVQLALFEPQAGLAPASNPQPGAAPNNKTKESNQAAPPRDALLAPGLTKQEILLSAVGSYPALLDWMRQLEKLNSLVVQSNLQLSAQPLQNTPVSSSAQRLSLPVELKMNVATYARGAQ